MLSLLTNARIMQTKRNTLLSDAEGFTLTELAVVIAVIGILSAVGITSYMGMRPTRNMSSDGRDLLSMMQTARVEAIRRNSCVGLILQPGGAPPADLSGAANRGGYTLFVDDGVGGLPAVSCDAIQNGGEQILNTTTVRAGVALTQSPIAVTAADPNYTSDTNTDLFTSISFDPRSLVATRGWAAGNRPIVFRNNPNPANATWWGRVIVTPSGSVEYQTNNNPANEAIWSR